MKKPDRGVALITVLLTLAFLFVLVTAIVATGDLTYRMTISSARSHRSAYIAESKLTRTMWNIVYDKKEFRNRSLGKTDDLGSEEQEVEERFWADGNPHIYKLDDKTVTVVIDDADRGFDFSGNITSTKIGNILRLIKLPSETTTDEKEPVDFFIDKLVDYTDRNDLFRENGLEREEYEEQYGFDLPRNAPIEFSEEVLWIPGIEDALFAQKNYIEDDFSDRNFNFKVGDYLRVVPPRGLTFTRNSRPNFFSATDYQILHLAELDQVEFDEVIEARRVWYKDRISIEESIPQIYTDKLVKAFSFTESGIFRIRIQVSSKDGSATVNSETIIDFNRALPRYIQDSFSGLRYWRKVNF